MDEFYYAKREFDYAITEAVIAAKGLLWAFEDFYESVVEEDANAAVESIKDFLSK